MTTSNIENLIGLSVPEWRALQSKSSSKEGLQRIINLVSSCKIAPEDPAWISLASKDLIESQWQNLQNLAHKSKNLPLYGVPCAIKDNIDVFGFETTAACPKYAYKPKEDATVITLLKSAGAIVIGKTNLDQFATGLVGTRSPYGKTPNSFSKDYVSGGSSAGSAVVVAKGIVPFSLGTDTAGSGRVPAALNNIIGLKPTRGIFSCQGVVPACKSLDCVSIFTLNLFDAKVLLSVMTDYDERDCYSRKFPGIPLESLGAKPKIAIPNVPQFYDEKLNPIVYEKAIKDFADKTGAELIPVDFSLLQKLALLLYEGPWVAERYAAIKDFVENHESDMDPTVRTIVKGATKYSAATAFEYEYKRQEVLKQIEAKFNQYDALLVPTAPLNPKISEVDAEPIAVNSKQGTYTNFVNLADLSALAIPAGFRSDGLPFGITLISKKFNDYALLDLASKYLKTETRRIGAIPGKVSSNEDIIAEPTSNKSNSSYKNHVSIAVVGMHLSGMILNHELTSLDSKLSYVGKTTKNYRLYQLNTIPPKPALRRVSGTELIGEKIEIEVWDVPSENVGKFYSFISTPLALGHVELEDGRWVKGFCCEDYLFKGARDVTEFGGWRGFMAHLKKQRPFEKVLISNRGEIALRIIKTLKKLGISSVAIYSESDKYSPHVLNANESISLGSGSAAETYLNIEKIIEAAKSTGSQAIIPGYGFLSENADFADACENAGIAFVGPTGQVIRDLGLKHSARQLAITNNVPLVPGTGILETVEDALKNANSIGYPVMLKSAAGGGGIGLQKCDSDKELAEAYESVRRLGKNYFKDDRVFLERFVDKARHVEVQIFGDGKGKAVALGERDCSLQRRNQKIIEETPAPELPDNVRKGIRESAIKLAEYVKYRCAGTVEFIYDAANKAYYFLEVNTRLQVEHPITEQVTGLDLVAWMLYIAAGVHPAGFNDPITINGASIETRVYAENPIKDFKPSSGQLTVVSFPSDVRVDTWISKGTDVTTNYDPLLAKIIVHGKDRADALKKLYKALSETAISGIVTNIDYLRKITVSNLFSIGALSTKALDNFDYIPAAIEIQKPGSYTTVQDYPGRVQLWRIGVPPSGPMDDYSFRLANKIVGNHPHAPGIEVTLDGPTILFHTDTYVSVTGGTTTVTIDGIEKPQWTALPIKRGQVLSVGKVTKGCRVYISIRDGLDVPEYLGSRSTFALGNMGGFNGRVLKFGDIIFLGQKDLPSCTIPSSISEPISLLPKELIPEYPSKVWNIGVLSGPHGAPDFFTKESMDNFISSQWKVHYNSNRFGVRLIGPKPTWTRKDGGEAGLHPSNVHDCVYALGAINFTGDEPVILTCDGPSLGGFVCPVTVAEAELWKVGQLKPGDSIQFVLLSFDEALAIKKSHDNVLEQGFGASLLKFVDDKLSTQEKNLTIANPIIYESAAVEGRPKVVYRQAGDRYILVEYGENVLDLQLSYRVYAMCELVEKRKTLGIVEMNTGVRSVLVQLDGRVSHQSNVLETLISYEKEIVTTTEWKVPSRRIRLPMAFEDSKTLASVDRYRETIRSNAPWLPNNVDFLKDVNHFEDRNVVKHIIYDASFLVLGLGDVFLGAPCAVPLDPRHRMLGTKYNPSRSFTPNGTVGIGGMYMCIYTMESPGGYQLVGRTIPIWDKLTLHQETPWLLKIYDRIEYYPVTEDELEVMCEQARNGKFKIDIQDGEFDYGTYNNWLIEHKEEITLLAEKQSKGNEEFANLIKVANSELEEAMNKPKDDGEIAKLEADPSIVPVYTEVAGRFWKEVSTVGTNVEKGTHIIILEAMKTEMVIPASEKGTVVKICFGNGDFIEAGEIVAYIKKN